MQESWVQEIELPTELPLSAVEWFISVVERGGPEPDDLEPLHRFFSMVNGMRKNGTLTDEQLGMIWDAMGPLGTTRSLMGHVYRKPHGYAGDYAIIDAIYARQVSDDEQLRRWDEYFHGAPAVQAVRNRSDYCLKSVKALFNGSGWSKNRAEPMNFLSLGCGPSQDIKPVVDMFAGRLRFFCVDQDINALQASKQTLAEHDDVEFVNQNVVRFQFDEKFDIVWSSGLFDYLNDRLFAAVLKRIRRHLRPGGCVIIGNFGLVNPSRDFMECGDWHLIHRSEQQLRDLAAKAGYEPDNTSVKAETTGINLFLHAKVTS